MADKEQDKRKINYRGLILEAIKLIASEREIPRGTEKDLVQDFLGFHRVGNYEDRIPATRECKIVLEHVFKYGRADIVMYHSDGSASVIEAKGGL
ncbi:hypothetical protein LX59_03044 [Azomonas agilis]|uniref:Uncharacterized protein n=1 Tax=Azomonas agilis TaxID=116849 RepID=A0A562HYN9_9GAMM|nr:hypothetical protein [Azomonas agilis]TWH63880.1 hypothetical protein LX59_03044 [Azomonas agilis]